MKATQAILYSALTLAALTTAAASDRYPWLDNLDEARALAAAENKPLLIVFRCEP